MFQSAESIHCKLGLLMYSTLLQDTERDSGGCNHTHTHTHSDYAVGLALRALLFFPTMHKVINYHTPDGEMST